MKIPNINCNIEMFSLVNPSEDPNKNQKGNFQTFFLIQLQKQKILQSSQFQVP